MNWKIILAAAFALAGIVLFILFPKPDSEDTTISIVPPLQKPVSQPIVQDSITKKTAPVEPLTVKATTDIGASTEQAITETSVEELEPLIEPPDQLDNSDSQVLNVIANIAPKLSTWLLPKQQIRKWVLTIDLLADGELPKKYPPLNFPMATFKVEKSAKQITAASANFTRTEPLITAITAIEPKLIARYYQHWLAILELAYREQGKPDSFDSRLHKAIEQILNVKPLTKTELLHQPHVFYQYTDPEHEQRSDLSKLMWRLGPENMQRIQRYLERLQKHL